MVELLSRKIFITDFGKEIDEAADNIINKVYAINNKTFACKGLLTGKLKISVVSTANFVMPYFLADFMSQHPGVELLMYVNNKKRAMKFRKAVI